MHLRLILALFLLLTCMLLSAQPKTHREVKRDFFPGTEKIKTITVIRITRNMHGDLFNYYKKTTVFQTEFDQQGKPVKKTKRITKLGNSGKHCYELFSRITEYDAKGKPKHFEKHKCDKKRQLIKEYENGEVIFIRKVKKRR